MNLFLPDDADDASELLYSQEVSALRRWMSILYAVADDEDLALTAIEQTGGYEGTILDAQAAARSDAIRIEAHLGLRSLN